MNTIEPFSSMVAEIRRCTICAPVLPLGPRPVVQLGPHASILIVSQAPGRKVHASGVPFQDASGDRLRDWMGIDPSSFYDATQVAILPMGFCYPGTGSSGDLPPRSECAPAWRAQILERLTQVKLTLVIGQYAQRYHLPSARGTVTDVVTRWREHWPHVVPLPHPSPRNYRWLKNNPWFDVELVPELRRQVATILDDSEPGRRSLSP